MVKGGGGRRPQAGAAQLVYSRRVRSPGQERGSVAVPAAKYMPRTPSLLNNKLFGLQKTVAFTIDHALTAAGIAVAIGSIAFAASMVAQNNRGTRAEPSDDFRLAKLARTGTPLAQEPFKTLDGPAIDYNATGSISRTEARHGVHRPRAGLNPAKAPSAAHQQSETYVLSFVYKNTALVKSHHGFYTAKPGTSLPGAGRVLSIERRGHKWVLVTERTDIAEAN
jgi:hypothetical protein